MQIRRSKKPPCQDAKGRWIFHSIPILKFLPLSLTILPGQPRRLMKRLLLVFITDESIPGVKSKITALLAAHVYNVFNVL